MIAPCLRVYSLRMSQDLRANLSAAAHLIHGTSEGRFRVQYCPGGLTQEEVESVGYEYGDLATMTQKYDPAKLKEGHNVMPDGEEIFYVSNPAVGLWAFRGRFEQTEAAGAGAAGDAGEGKEGNEAAPDAKRLKT